MELCSAIKSPKTRAKVLRSKKPMLAFERAYQAQCKSEYKAEIKAASKAGRKVADVKMRAFNPMAGVKSLPSGGRNTRIAEDTIQYRCREFLRTYDKDRFSKNALEVSEGWSRSKANRAVSWMLHNGNIRSERTLKGHARYHIIARGVA